jgi:hypothetical protein
LGGGTTAEFWFGDIKIVYRKFRFLAIHSQGLTINTYENALLIENFCLNHGFCEFDKFMKLLYILTSLLRIVNLTDVP